MKILLINSNPVVSRLTALSARKEEIQIDEVQEINEVNNSQYDIVFVDSDSWSKELESAISQNIQTQKRVLFYAQDDKNNNELFDISILKPFLPSEVSAVIRSVEESALSSALSTDKSSENLIELEEKSVFDVLEISDEEKVEKKEEKSKEIDKKEDFLSLDLDEKVVKEDMEEDLFAELKDNSKDFDKQLEEAFPLKKEEDLFDLDLSGSLEKEFDVLNKEEKSIKKEKDELFDFNLDNNDEFDLDFDALSDDKINIDNKVKSVAKKEVEVKKEEIIAMPIKKEKKSEEKLETKILDQSELLNIKDILENDDDSTIELDDLMTTPAVEMIQTSDNSLDNSSNNKKEKKSESQKLDEDASLEAENVINTLSVLPLDRLKGLLAGSTIKITIKFPKEK
ncbi:MAG: hypothetical protein DSZ07_05395 [Sulfurovum sp.]|nr:MAG: hypothetical protein DSZ07_05395 [Sulfurovum sp.]